MGKQFLSSDRLYLRPVEPDDLDVMYEMENDPTMWDISNFTVPYSRYVLRQYITQSQSDMFADKQLRLMVVRRSDNTVLGTLDITDFVPLHRRGEVGIAMRSEYRRQGYAQEALFLLIDYAFRFLSLHQLVAHVAVDNEASLQLFASVGFLQCGLLKDWLRIEGAYKDVVILQRLSPQL